ncbi:GntR family transcriptional regulator [Pseudomonas syringae pv. primulae]|nr:GntR family transcriptional regulator [Pseudomonas syringae pv. primulae]
MRYPHHKPHLAKMRIWFSEVSLASSSTVTGLRSLLPMQHPANAQVRGAPTYEALAAEFGGLDQAVDLDAGSCTFREGLK